LISRLRLRAGIILNVVAAALASAARWSVGEVRRAHNGNKATCIPSRVADLFDRSIDQRAAEGRHRACTEQLAAAADGNDRRRRRR
jgi:hypothetical protein